MIRVAIDGPGGAGKSTIAKMLAHELGIEYVDTGAMYRAIALKMIRQGVSCEDEIALAKLLDNTEVDFINNRIVLDGEDVSDEIRTERISMAASDCSKLKIVRDKMVSLQQRIAADNSVVMDGRDIGTVVITDAEVKIYMTADAGVRAKRRYDQLLEAGKTADYDSILQDIQARDYQDMHREVTPLRQAEDALYLDTSDMTIEEVVEFIRRLVCEREQ